MAFPKKNTRSIIVDSITYLWHRNHDFEIHTSWIVVQQKDIRGQLLLVDAYHSPGFGPAAVADAIRYALLQGWHSAMRGKPFRVFYDQDAWKLVPLSDQGFEYLHHRDQGEN
jgi:hypothetical protein